MRAHNVWGALLCLVSSACGGATPGGAGGVPSAGPNARYETAVPDANAPPRSPVAEAVEQVLRSARPRPVRDPRLDHVAARLLEGERLRTPEVRVIDGLMREQGLVEPVPQVGAAAGASASSVARLLAEDTTRAVASSQVTHYGVASVDRGGNARGLVLLASRFVDLEPVPSRLSPGDQVSLRGELHAGHHDPRWVVTLPDGSVQRLDPASGNAFSVEVPLPDKGEYRLELLAAGPGGVTVVANFPVWAGERPARVQVQRASGPRTADSARAVEARLRELIAQERKRRELPPLDDTDALDEVSQAHCQDMLDHNFVGHESPHTGGPDDRVRAAGLSAWLVRENVGRGYSAEEIHAGLMQSPGHRDNLLSADAELLGLGVVQVPEEPAPAYLATQVFASLSRPIDVKRARQRLLQHVAQERKRAGLARAAPSEPLMQAAQRAAERYFQDAIDQKALLNGALKSAPALPEGAHVGGSMTVVQSVKQATQSPLGREPKARWFGIGVAQGKRQDAGPHAIAIVVLYGVP